MFMFDPRYMLQFPTLPSAVLLHQLIDAIFYLFGFIFPLTSPFVFIPLASSSPGWTSIANLSISPLAPTFFSSCIPSDGLRVLSALRFNT